MEKASNISDLVGIMWVNSLIITLKEEESIFHLKFSILVNFKTILFMDRENSDYLKKILHL